MCYGNGRFRHDSGHALCHLFNTHHPIVDEVDLPTSVQLAQDGSPDEGLVVFCHCCLYRQPFLRRRVNGAHIAYPGQRHMKRSRYRSGGECQYVHLSTHFLQPLFVAHAKALFLVNDQ